MSEDINKHLLSQFYGFRDVNVDERKFLSSSKGIESFDNVTDLKGLSTEHLISSELETGRSQNAEEDFEGSDDENNRGCLPKSPHGLTIEDLTRETEKNSEDSISEPEIIDEPKYDKNVATKSFPRLDDTFTKAMAKMSETAVQGSATSSTTNLNQLNFPTNPVTKAKRLWRQKTISARENVITSPNLLDNFNGTHLNLNNSGICTFPTDILQRLTLLQMLYLDSNNLVELPDEMFTTLKNLRWLDVRNNHLVVIPASVKGHACLETLFFQGNNIEKLPLELGLIPNLKNLQVAHNPITFPPKEILDLDCSRIINFLRTLWNREHPNEIVQLRKLSNEKIVSKKPSTIICYQPTPSRKPRGARYGASTPKTAKTSVRSRTWNYKPNSRYGADKNSWVLRRVDLGVDDPGANLADNFLICNFCAASLYRTGVHVENELAYCGDRDCRRKSCVAMKQHQSRSCRESRVYSPESMAESNFLRLLGPSPRSLFIRKNLDFLVNASKRRNVRLCRIEPVDFDPKGYKKLKLRNVKPLKISVKERVFDVVTDSRVKAKIKPMQLREPGMILNFLTAYLGISTQRSYAKKKLR